ncbi:transposase [Glycomyces halotolerans]
MASRFGIPEAIAWRRVRETIGLLAAKATGLRQALRRAKRAGWAFVILDGTLIRTQRHRLDRLYYSGKHRHHGMNLQAIASLTGDRGLDEELVATPFGGRGKPAWQKEHNWFHTRLRRQGERAFAQLKQWGVFDRVRCDPHQTTQIAKAIGVLIEYDRRSR